MEPRREMSWTITNNEEEIKDICLEVFDPDEPFANADDAEGQAWEKVVEMGGLEKGEHFILYCNGNDTLAVTSILKVCMREGINIRLMHRTKNGWMAQEFDMEELGKAGADAMLWDEF